MTDVIRPFTIYIRHEGEMLNAYWTRSRSMDDAELVASIHFGLGKEKPELYDAFCNITKGITEHRRAQLGDLHSAIAFLPRTKTA